MLKRLTALLERVPFGLKILGGFIAVILVAVLVVYVIVNVTIVRRFDDFNRNRVRFEMQEKAIFFAHYYQRQGSWNGVENVFADLTARGFPKITALLLTDVDGTVIASANPTLVGQTIDPSLDNHRVPVQVGEEVSGYLSMTFRQDPRSFVEQSFLEGVSRVLLLAGLTASFVGILISLMLTRQLTRPLGELAQGALKVAEGDLKQRVDIRSSDALGQLGNAFNTMTDQLNHSEQLRQHMLTDLAHELRTPLTIIQGDLQAMRDEVYAPTQERITSIHDESLRLERLIDDLKSLSLAEAGQLPLNKQSIDLGTLLHKLVKASELQFQQKHIEVRVEIPNHLRVMADPDRLRQVLWNLLKNALNHTPKGGRVTLSAEDCDTHCQLSVADTGPGILPEELPHVFDRFWRSDQARQHKSGGTGLGLAIARQLVLAHGGEIWVADPCDDGGAVFVFTLPK